MGKLLDLAGVSLLFPLCRSLMYVGCQSYSKNLMFIHSLFLVMWSSQNNPFSLIGDGPDLVSSDTGLSLLNIPP
jgi:hypothetical protein